MKIYIVERNDYVILCVFRHKEDAELFVKALDRDDELLIRERTLFDGQPPYPGYNK